MNVSSKVYPRRKRPDAHGPTAVESIEDEYHEDIDDPPDAWDDPALDDIPIDDIEFDAEHNDNQAPLESDSADGVPSTGVLPEEGPVVTEDDQAADPDEPVTEVLVEPPEPDVSPIDPVADDTPEVDEADATMV